MRKYKKLLSVICCFVIMAAFAIPAFAVDSSSVASEAVSAMSEGFKQVTTTISIGNILQVLTIVLGVAVGFFFFWWGIRKVIRVVTKSFKSGKVSV